MRQCSPHFFVRTTRVLRVNPSCHRAVVSREHLLKLWRVHGLDFHPKYIILDLLGAPSKRQLHAYCLYFGRNMMHVYQTAPLFTLLGFASCSEIQPAAVDATIISTTSTPMCTTVSSIHLGSSASTVKATSTQVITVVLTLSRATSQHGLRTISDLISKNTPCTEAPVLPTVIMEGSSAVDIPVSVTIVKPPTEDHRLSTSITKSLFPPSFALRPTSVETLTRSRSSSSTALVLHIIPISTDTAPDTTSILYTSATTNATTSGILVNGAKGFCGGVPGLLTAAVVLVLGIVGM
ncbi:uncharacterized protein CC84DRAFT_562461 [Paraphaeosphaeria sporulosa]|uniref:Uncharacterized protein n=1 Tax=Paraphaeosphaeria sporulosa TaxID=1460663 RepID=A0A177CLT7_9PLEO|nr:uncharacterized protein CC84DRAFT_562461 [Paraphaeosphaeria sporulosa]OAG08211.1 hypothetical protein CC84DRAFT_562461 [Paraphaeosphaeria sporulosa]